MKTLHSDSNQFIRSVNLARKPESYRVPLRDQVALFTRDEGCANGAPLSIVWEDAALSWKGVDVRW